jgi:hypothetical protein
VAAGAKARLLSAAVTSVAQEVDAAATGTPNLLMQVDPDTAAWLDGTAVKPPDASEYANASFAMAAPNPAPSQPLAGTKVGLSRCC